MYKEAEEVIKRGLSPGARRFLAFFSGFIGTGLYLIALNSKAPIPFFAFGTFCNLIVMVCITKGKIRQFIGSIIGTLIFLFAFIYIYSQLTNGPLNSGARSEPSIINSIVFMLVFGVPSLIYALKTKFGFAAKKNTSQKQQ